MDKDYDVGYGKPPMHSRFRKGQSGNPKGRPKGQRNFKTDLCETLKATVQLKEKGQKRTVSTQKAALYRLREKALSGDARALDRLIELARIYNDEELGDAASSILAASDQDILDAYAERQSRHNGERAPKGKVPRRRLRRQISEADA